MFLPILKILFALLEWLKFLKGSLQEDSPIVAPAISHILFIYLFWFYLLYLRNSETFMGLVRMVKKFEFGGPNWGRPFWFSQILLYMVLLYLTKLKVSCVQLKWLEVLNFDNPDWGETLWYLYTLVIFCFPFLFTYFESFMGLTWMVEKFEFWRTQWRDSPFCGTPNFVFPS